MGETKVVCGCLYCMGIGTPNLCIIQGSTVNAGVFWGVLLTSKSTLDTFFFFCFSFCACHFLVFCERIKLCHFGLFQTFFSWHAKDCWCTPAETHKTLYQQPSYWHLRDTWKVIQFLVLYLYYKNTSLFKHHLWMRYST